MTTTENDEIRQRALDRARRIFSVWDDTEGSAEMALGAAFHAAADALRDEADAATERRKKGWQSYVKELQQVAARLVGIAQDLAELSKLEPSEPPTEPEQPSVARTEAQTQFFADRSAEPEPYTAATDPATSQADVVAYLKGDTDTMPAGLAPEQEDRLIEHAERLTIEAGNEVGAPGIPVHPTITDVQYVINGEDVTHQVISHDLHVPAELDATRVTLTDVLIPQPIREAFMTLRFEDPLPPSEVFGPRLPPGVDASARRSFTDLMKPVDPALYPDHWSWSQLTSSEDCGLQQRLSRLEGVKQIPQWANVGGTTFHAIAETFDRGAWRAGGADLLPEADPELIAQRWNGALEEEILRVTEASGIKPGEEGEHWRAANRGKENLTWWRVEGERMLAGYIRMRRTLDKAAREAGTLAQPLELPDLSNLGAVAPMIEWEYVRPQSTPAGTLTVKGIIDRAYRCSDGSIMIKDLKTSGRVDSTSTGQLGEYAQAILHLLQLNEQGLARVTGNLKIMGCFYDARREIFTEPVDLLAKHPADEYAYRYGAAEAHRRLGVAQPHRSNFCVSCSVAYACPVGSA